ncbi:MAG: FAD/NAD(P)-binding protein [Syntrophobacteraceae bacterium]|jgi:NAD(P)H-flavin reductase|nr:FAD/NAD(P)-binding protein [Syntrophobacteraceae bacterium]
MIPMPYVVRRAHRETTDTFTLEMAPTVETTVAPFLPGQFNMLYAFGVGEVPISVSGNPAESACLTHTVRAVGSVTRALCDADPGDMVGVRGPFGTSWPVDGAMGGDVMLVAGGLGLAPLRPAMYAVLSNRSAFQRIVLIYGARTPDDLLYRREVEKWGGHPDLQVEVTVDSGGRDWQGHVGVVTTLIGRTVFDPARTTAFICGPELMMRFTVLELLRQGVAEERIFVSLERNMKCGVGLCGHCQLGPFLTCRDGPVIAHSRARDWLGRREA